MERRTLASSLKGSIYSDTRIFPQVFNVHLKWKEKKKPNLESIGKDVCFKQAWSCLEIGLGIIRKKKIGEETWSPRPPVGAGRNLEIMQHTLFFHSLGTGSEEPPVAAHTGPWYQGLKY